MQKLSTSRKKAKPVEGGKVGAAFSLEDVQYTSPTEAAAQFYNCHTIPRRVCTTIIATTQDGWAHAAGVAIPDGLADLVSYTPLGRGAVAIKAEEQLVRRKSYPPFVLSPTGKLTPLHVTREPRALGAGSDLIGAWNLPFEVGARGGMWAADVDAMELYPVLGAPGGDLWEHAPGRGDSVLSVIGTHNTVGNGVWRFAESTDNTRSWRISDVRLAVGKPPWGYSDHGEDHAVGPGHLQALAWTDAPTELYLPEFLRDLWRTDDEKTFRRVPLPWKRLPAGGMPFSGMAFASDGALLLAEATGSPPSLCPDGICHPGRIWRLPAGETEMKPLLHAPRLSGPFWRYNLLSGGGVIVARTGPRAIAVSRDSYVWTKLTPGR